MKNNIIAHEIRELLEVIREQQELILSHEENIPQIEFDILMGNIRKLYERLNSLQKNNVSKPSPAFIKSADELIAHLPPPESVPVAPQPPASPIHLQPETLIGHVDTPVITPPNEISEEAVMPQAVLARERTREFTKPSSTATLFDENPSVSEKVLPSPTLYDKIAAGREDKSIATKLQKNPVSDLKKSIGINEKFAFINELFDGNLSFYNEAIDRLNGSESHTSALTILERELSARHNWNGESDSYQKLKNLVDRRFGA